MFHVTEGTHAIDLCKKLSVHADKFIEVAKTLQMEIMVVTVSDDDGLDHHEIDASTTDGNVSLSLVYEDDTFTIQVGKNSVNLTSEHITNDTTNKVIAFLSSL